MREVERFSVPRIPNPPKARKEAPAPITFKKSRRLNCTINSRLPDIKDVPKICRGFIAGWGKLY
jgi:hypothetical protein